ncbi:MAG: MlaD family protein [Thermoleophilaceae bacterium]
MIRVLAASLAVVGACLAIVFGTGATSDSGTGKHWKLEFDNAFGLVNGADFKMAGVRAGAITKLELSKGFPPKAIVDVEATQPGLRSLRSDATCEVRPQSLIGEYYVDCNPGSSSKEIPNGGTLPVKQTTSTIPIDVVQNILRRPYSERLRIIIMTLGAGLAGRPQDLSAAIHRAAPGLRATTQTLGILARQEKILDRFISDSDTVIAALAHRKTDVRQFVHQAARTASVSATRRDALAQSMAKLPGFLTELKPTMARLGELADAQIPVLRNTRRAAPALTTAFQRLGPFSDAARPGLRSLGDLSRTGSSAIKASDPVVAQLRKVSDQAPQLAKPLRQFLQTIDDRKRSIETDIRAKATAPPAPDKAAYKPGDGFTGMESLLNYFYWQTLAINGFDKVSHVLRFTILVSQCSPYQTNPSADLIKNCASWLGPHQPGINAPDPTAKGGAAKASDVSARNRRTSSRTPAAGGGSGGGSAPSTPPKPTLPPELQSLLGGLTGKGVPSLPSAPSVPVPQSGGGAPTDPANSLLDYLLGP